MCIYGQICIHEYCMYIYAYAWVFICMNMYICIYLYMCRGCDGHGKYSPRVGLKHTSLTFRASVLPLLLWCHDYPMPTCLCSSLPQRSVQTSTLVYPGIVSLLMLTITYIQAMIIHIHRQGRFNNHAVHCLYRNLVMTPVSWVWWKWEILCLEWDSNSHLWHPGPVGYNCTT